MKKIGLIILCLVWYVSYYLKFINPMIPKIIVDYIITFGYCIGTAIIAFDLGKKENNWTKHLFFHIIGILNLSIVGTYIIDLIFDSLFGTTKVIFTILITSIIGLCIYLLKPKS